MTGNGIKADTEGEQAAHAESGQTCAGTPKIRNAKVLRRVIRASVLGENPGDNASLKSSGDQCHPRNDVKFKKKIGGSGTR